MCVEHHLEDPLSVVRVINGDDVDVIAGILVLECLVNGVSVLAHSCVGDLGADPFGHEVEIFGHEHL